ncbi:MAG: amidohydrolase, partial [Erysipelotrichia bacterium]|nr:amidohydrolase [Erysipelotrichia bacterium]
LVPYFAPTNLDESNALGHLFYGMMHSFKPSDVFVAGEQVVKDYELTNRKLVSELENSQEIANSLWKRIKGEK